MFIIDTTFAVLIIVTDSLTQLCLRFNNDNYYIMNNLLVFCIGLYKFFAFLSIKNKLKVIFLFLIIVYWCSVLYDLVTFAMVNQKEQYLTINKVTLVDYTESTCNDAGTFEL